MTCVLINRGIWDTVMHTERTPCEHKSTDWGDASPSQGTPNIASKPSEAKRSGTDFSSQPSEEINFVDTMISESQPPELRQ